MTTPKNDLTGLVFGKTTVLAYVEKRNGFPYYLCRCECGYEREVTSYTLLAHQAMACRSCAQKTHGLTQSKAHHVWNGLLQRCTNKRNKDYPRYGGRGITVDPRWAASFVAFLDDMGHPPEGTSLDRIDNDGAYTKDNCRWATVVEQARNRREYENGHKVRMGDATYYEAWWKAKHGDRTSTTSRYNGVCFDKRRNKWMVRVKAADRYIYVGRFDDELSAAKAFDVAAAKYQGERAMLNFPNK